MSVIPLRQEAPQPYVLKLHNSTYTLDPYRDRLEAQGFKVVDGSTYQEALELAERYRPALILVQDAPESGIDALRWLEIQHTARAVWMAMTPLVILAEEGRLPVLLREELPDRVIVLQRRADTLNRLVHTSRHLVRVWGSE